MKRINRILPVGNIILLCSILLLVFASCSDDSSSEDGTDIIINPIIQTGDFFPDSNWNDPHVIHDGTQFVMFASAARNFDFNVKIYRLVSADGIDWNLSPPNAVFEKSADGDAWDSKSVETPAVVYYNGQYHMFYTGYETVYNDSGNFKIGHATSPDGIIWTRQGIVLEPTDPHDLSDPDNPVWVDPNLQFNQYVVAEPGPVVFNGKIYLYFTAMGANAGVGTTLQVIGLATYDGSTWTLPEKVLEPDQTLYPRASYYGYSTPNAIVRNGKIHLYFDVVADPWKQVKIHHAVSDNGTSGWIHDSAPLLNREDFSWTQEEIRSPSALEYNNKLYLYFAGHTGLNLAIGLKIY